MVVGGVGLFLGIFFFSVFIFGGRDQLSFVVANTVTEKIWTSTRS